jgi:hypothetical protein
LILDVADYFQRQPGAVEPEALALARQVRQWHTLPEAGGLRDQRAGEMDRLAVAENVYNALLAWKKCPANQIKRWVATHPEAWRICKLVEKLREARG